MSLRRARPSHRAQRGSSAGVVRAGVAAVSTVGVLSYALLLNPTTGAEGTADGLGRGPTSLENEFDTSAATTTPAVSKGEVSQVGQVRSRENSETTLLQVRKVLAPEDRTAPEGQEWYGIRARTCMNADANASGAVPWSGWVVVTAAGSTYAGSKVAWSDFPPQQYSAARVATGKCNVGWVLVNVPRGTFKSVVKVAYQPASPDPLEWNV